jgi:uncharacterized protein YggT (Ycf19 family)
MAKDHLIVDESRRIERHEQVKDTVEARVRDDIRATVDATDPPQEHGQVRAVAGHLREKALSEVVRSEAEIDRARSAARVSQVVDYLFFLIYGLIGLEIGLDLLGARHNSGFKRFLDAVTTPLLGPFRGLMPDPAVGSFQLMISYIVAFVVYVLLHKAVTGLLKLLAERRSAM